MLDPQGAAVGNAMKSLDFPASNVRVGKTIAFEVDGTDTPETREKIEKLGKDLLSNPVIEDFTYEIK